MLEVVQRGQLLRCPELGPGDRLVTDHDERGVRDAFLDEPLLDRAVALRGLPAPLATRMPAVEPRAPTATKDPVVPQHEIVEGRPGLGGQRRNRVCRVVGHARP